MGAGRTAGHEAGTFPTEWSVIMSSEHLFSSFDASSLPRTAGDRRVVDRRQPRLQVKSALRFAVTFDDEPTLPTTAPPMDRRMDDAADDETEVVDPWTREARTEAAAVRHLKALRSQTQAHDVVHPAVVQRSWAAAVWSWLQGLLR